MRRTAISVRGTPRLGASHALMNMLLALCLLIAQQAAYTHALSHFDHRTPGTENKQLPHSKACERCGVSGQLGTGLLKQPTLFFSDAEGDPVVSPRLHGFHPATPRRFLSRAPPTSE